MEVPSDMEETQKTEDHLTSAAAFVEGGIQDACDDACSICLEAFCDSDPSTVTNCRHEFHLQCILEWCQRSSQCPMCWQSISLKDPIGQELLEAVEQERSFRLNPSRNATIFHHPALGDFEFQHLGANDGDFEERIIQHLAAAAAMGRAHHISRREGQRSRATTQGRPQFLVFSTHSNAPPAGPVTASPTQREADNEQHPAIIAASPSVPLTAVGEEPSQRNPHPSPVRTDWSASPASGSSVSVANRHGSSFNNRSSGSQSSSVNHDRAGPSDLQSFSESLKSRFSAVSNRYKESISKSTRGWKERLFSRNNSMSDLGPEVTREVNEGIASVSRMIEHLEMRENSGAAGSSVSNNSEGPVVEPGCPTLWSNACILGIPSMKVLDAEDKMHCRVSRASE
ncbi:hypothetical protein NE237_005164 [Protea cynaroides]|uniref:RING-type E3 ubiquitin transferase n=1 Tax=Protea cynaroides TaxID=273540 RepID=A0A9Q0KKC7_9MAGN|nr:hypothetical protein NE237_005164 [Protea cynaroides]